ncbi:MAG TPA: hypothetical protein VGC41_04835 [Kofleriaceae bacterium]
MTDAGYGLVVGFVLVVAATLWFAQRAVAQASSRARGPFLIGACAWLAILAALALRGFFQDPHGPRLAVAIGPPVVATILMLIVAKRFVAALPLKTLTYLHLVRAGVEFCLFGLAMDKLIPDEMSFAGRNFDIIIGFTAPLFGNLAFLGPVPAKKPLIIWNLIALAMLMHIVVVAVLSAPGPLQHWNFDRPNLAILTWPFVWLPGFVVPVVLASHLVSLRRLIRTA